MYHRLLAKSFSVKSKNTLGLLNNFTTGLNWGGNRRIDRRSIFVEQTSQYIAKNLHLIFVLVHNTENMVTIGVKFLL